MAHYVEKCAIKACDIINYTDFKHHCEKSSSITGDRATNCNVGSMSSHNLDITAGKRTATARYRLGHSRRHIKPYGTSHEDVVMVARLRRESSRLPALVDGQFVTRIDIALHIGIVAHHTYEMIYDDALGRAVGVKSHAKLLAASHAAEQRTTVEIGVDMIQLRQHVERVLAVGVFGFKSVALNHQQGRVIPLRY